MNVIKPNSLGDLISKKISVWILIFVSVIIAALFSVSFLLSKKMFNNQVNIWNTAVPRYTITNLIDSDYFSIQREIAFIKTTGLFSSFAITDNQRKTIAYFGAKHLSEKDLKPIQDSVKAIWGYYSYQPDFYRFFAPYFIAVFVFLGLVLAVYFVIRWRIRSNLESEFSQFNNFLSEIELATEKLHEIYDQKNPGPPDSREISYNTEQVIIKRAISRLFSEIQKANQSLRKAVAASEQRRFQEELTRTALQVAHDIASPLVVLDFVTKSTSFTMPEQSKELYQSAGNLLYTVETGLPAFDHIYGKNFWEYLDDSPQKAELFHDAMEKGSKAMNKQIISHYDFSSYQYIVDVGGGKGHLLCEILSQNPNTRGAVYDITNARQPAMDYINQQYLSDRCTIETGNFFISIPQNADLYLLKVVLHDWDDQSSTLILKNCREAMSKTSKLLIIEKVIEENKFKNLACLGDINMLVTLTGKERSLPEFQDLLHKGGFKFSRKINTKTVFSIIEATLI